MEQICQHCKYWRLIRETDLLYEGGKIQWPGPHGECHIIDEFSTDRPAWLAGMADDDLSLITQPGFGCALWEATETASEQKPGAIPGESGGNFA